MSIDGPDHLSNAAMLERWAQELDDGPRYPDELAYRGVARFAERYATRFGTMKAILLPEEYRARERTLLMSEPPQVPTPAGMMAFRLRQLVELIISEPSTCELTFRRRCDRGLA